MTASRLSGFRIRQHRRPGRRRWAPGRRQALPRLQPGFGASAAQLALADQRQPGLLVTLSAIGLPESVLTEWQALPVSTPSPSREAVARSATVYVPTLEDPLEPSFVTAAVATLDPGQRTLRYCLAGHLSPLLREPGGTVTTLGGARGAVLGFGAGDRPERMVTFGAGSILVLFAPVPAWRATDRSGNLEFLTFRTGDFRGS